MVAGRLLVARTFSSFFRSSMMASSAAARSPTAARVLVADGGPLPVVCTLRGLENWAQTGVNFPFGVLLWFWAQSVVQAAWGRAR
jgi:hypothetical protein